MIRDFRASPKQRFLSDIRFFWPDVLAGIALLFLLLLIGASAAII